MKEYKGHTDACDECGIHQAMHFGDRDLCCWCHIKTGGLPADWHTVCMSEYRKKDIVDDKTN